MFKHVHQSGRFDRSLRLLSQDINQFHKRGSIVTHTEMSNDDRESVFPGHPGWSFYRSTGVRGAKECVVEWSDALWELAGKPHAKALTDETFWRVGGAKAPRIHAITVPLKHLVSGETVIVTVAHMPVLNTLRRSAVWDSAAAGWQEHIRTLRVQYPDSHQLVVADWNANFRNPVRRRRLAKVWRPLRLKAAWEGNLPKRGGTHGRSSLIDGDYTDLVVADCSLLPDTKSSDHRAYMATYRWPK